MLCEICDPSRTAIPFLCSPIMGAVEKRGSVLKGGVKWRDAAARAPGLVQKGGCLIFLSTRWIRCEIGIQSEQ